MIVQSRSVNLLGMLDTQQAISVYIYEEACCLFMHTDTEHILVNLVGRWCQETPETGRVWGSELAVQILSSSVLLASFISPPSPFPASLPSIFPLFPWPATLRISHLAHISALLSSPLSHHPHCLPLSPFSFPASHVCCLLGEAFSIFLKGTPPPEGCSLTLP